MKKISSVLLVALLLLTGCFQQQPLEDSTNEVITSYVEGEYNLIMPYELSGARYWHGNALSKFDAIEVEKGLNQRSQEYFDPEEYIQSAGTLLDDEDVQMLQRRESSEYAYALNPPLGTFEVNEVISVEDPYLVYDVVEVNYYHPDDHDTLAGIALTILMNSDVTSDSGSTIELTKERLYTFGSYAGRKLESYIRQLDGVSADCPIYITLYASALENSSVPGTYIGDAYFVGRSGQFETIDEEWVLFPTAEAEMMDATMYSQFLAIKSEVSDFLPENVDIIGLGRYEDKLLQELKIDINAQAKTYNELNALAQLVSNLLESLDTATMDCSVEIKMFDTTYFTLVKKQGESTISIHDVS